jgi:hypothetical protein
MHYTPLGTVAGPVIQATGRSEFEDGLVDRWLCVGLLISHECPHWVAWSYKADQIPTALPGHVWNVPSILNTEVKKHQDCHYSDGWPPQVKSLTKEKAEELLARSAGVVSHREAMVQIHSLHTRLPKHCTLACSWWVESWEDASVGAYPHVSNFDWTGCLAGCEERWWPGGREVEMVDAWLYGTPRWFWSKLSRKRVAGRKSILIQHSVLTMQSGSGSRK